MSYIKETNDKMFLGRVSLPKLISDSGTAIGVNEDGTLVKVSSSDPTPIAISDVTGLQSELDSKQDSNTALQIGTTATTAKAGNAAPLAHNQAFTTITGIATLAQLPALTIAKTTGLQAALDAKLTATKGIAVADAVDETDVVAQFNALLASLRTAGIILI